MLVTILWKNVHHKMFCGKLIKNKIEKPTAQKKIEEKLPGQILDWTKIYSYARQTTLDSFLESSTIN